MPDPTESEADEIDLAVACYREEGVWQLQELPEDSLVGVESIARQLRRYPGDNGAIALIAVDEDFFLIVRFRGAEVSLLPPDASASPVWALALSAVDHIGGRVKDDDDPAPAGDLGI